MSDESLLSAYRRRISGFSKNARLFTIASTAAAVAGSLYSLLFNLYLLAVGYSTGFLGLLVSLSSIASVVFAVPVGRLATVMGHRRLMLVAAAATAVVMLAQVMWPSPAVLIVGTILAAMENTALSVVGGPFMTENSTPEERAHLFTIQGALGMASGVAGNILGGALPVVIAAVTGWRPQDPQALKYAMLGGILVLFVPVLWPLWEIRATTEKETGVYAAPGPAAEDGKKGIGNVLGRALGLVQPVLVFKLALPSLVTSLGAGLIVPFFNVFYQNLGGEPGTIGLIFAAQSVLTALAYLVAPVLAARWGKVHMVSYVQVASVPFLLAMALAPGLWWAAGWGLIRNALMNMANPISSTFSMEILAPQERAAANGVFTIAWSLGWAVASPIAGLLMETVSYRASYWPAAVLYLAGAAINLWFFGHYDRLQHA